MGPNTASGAAQREMPEVFRPRAWWWLVAWAGAAALLLLLKLPTLHDPYFWDAVGCYYPQALELAYNARNFLTGTPEFVRPPLYDGSMAAVMRWVSDTPLALHIATVIWTALTLPATYALTRTLGGGKLASVLATALCLCTPLFFAQAPLIQTDLPATALMTMGWLMALRGRWVLYALFGGLAVLTKESTYYLCLPAAVLLYGRATQGRAVVSFKALLGTLPAAVPGVVLAGWLVVHRSITGHFMHPDHSAALGSVNNFLVALLHNFVEGGRGLLAICALLVIVPMLRRSAAASRLRTGYPRLEILATSLLWISLPLGFPTELARYMVPSLPALCALAALGLWQLGSMQRTAASALLLGVLISLWNGDSWHSNWPHDAESNLEYRQVLWIEHETAARLLAVNPRRVLSEFPMRHILSAPASAGYLPAPIPVQDLSSLHVPQDVCKSDYLVMASSTNHPVLEAARLLGYLVPWQTIGDTETAFGRRRLTPFWARYDPSLRIFQVSCPDANK